MKNNLVSLALLTTVVAAAAFQVVLLFAASFIGGAEKVGEVSIYYSVAVLLNAVCLSDLKSLSIRVLAQNQSLGKLCSLRNAFFVLLLIIALTTLMLPHVGLLLAELIVLRASVQAADVNVSLWQKLQKPGALMLLAGLRYGLVAAVLFGVGVWTRNFELGLGTAMATSLAIVVGEQALLQRLNPAAGLGWLPIGDLRTADHAFLAGYFSLSLAAGLNFLPQVILRYQLIAFGTLSMLGHFSVQYQISMLTMPLITALSQQALARAHNSWQDILRDIALIGSCSVLVLSISTLVFLTPASEFVGMVFKSWQPLDPASTILISAASLALCLTIYLGFISVALHRPMAQSIANLIFLAAMVGAGFGLGFVWGPLGVMIGFVLACITRMMLLVGIVHRATMA